MTAFLPRRLGESAVTLLLATMVVFAGARLLPGDPAIALSGEGRDPRANAQIRQKYGLDDPVPVQYVRWVALAAQGNFGKSIRNGSDVSHTIVARLPVTLELAVISIGWATLFGIASGVLAAIRRNRLVDRATSLVGLLGLSIPTFWLGLVFVIVFAVELRWLPASGFTPFFANPAQNLVNMLMPTFVLGAGVSAMVMRQTRSAMIGALASDYVRAARAKGISEVRVVLRHALRNSLLTVVTIVGLEMGAIISGAVVTEQIFLIPGFGRLLVDSIATRDYPVIEGATLVGATGYIVLNLLVDLVYTRLNPRIHLEEARPYGG